MVRIVGALRGMAATRESLNNLLAIEVFSSGVMVLVP